LYRTRGSDKRGETRELLSLCGDRFFPCRPSRRKGQHTQDQYQGSQAERGPAYHHTLFARLKAREQRGE
jgi:hypothetical protein